MNELSDGTAKYRITSFDHLMVNPGEMRSKKHSARRWILFSCIIPLFTTLACNFPLFRQGNGFNGNSEFEQTKQAILKTLQVTKQPGSTTPISPTINPVPIGSDFDPSKYIIYTARSGDTLHALAAHFGVEPVEILSGQSIRSIGLLPIGQELAIPRPSFEFQQPNLLFKDGEVVFAPCARSFDIKAYIDQAGGWLSSYHQTVNAKDLSGAEIVSLVAENTSVNPRYLLAFIEYRSGGVLGYFGNVDNPYPLEMETPDYRGLYLELSLAAKLTNMGYYGWRQGTLTELSFQDGSTQRIAPILNPGSVGAQYLFARINRASQWKDALYGPEGFLSTYQTMFSADNLCSTETDEIFPDQISIPLLELPFATGESWALTGGLHSDWNTGTPWGALDFAPITGEAACSVSRAWVRASAPGIVDRTGEGVLTLTLIDENGDPNGWTLLYMHIAQKARIPTGSLVRKDDPLGHPSCEGDSATGTHVHIARLYHGEWIGAGDPFPLILSGWTALPAEKQYLSALVKGDMVVDAKPDGSAHSTIIR